MKNNKKTYAPLILIIPAVKRVSLQMFMSIKIIFHHISVTVPNTKCINTHLRQVKM